MQNIPTLSAKQTTTPQPNNLPRVLTTRQAAAYLNRQPQTLRKWGCYENGPIRPLRINGRLAWRLDDVLDLLTGSHYEK